MPGGIENRFAGSVSFEHLSSWLQYLKWREREKRERERLGGGREQKNEKALDGEGRRD